MHGNFEFIESKDVTESCKCMYQIQSGEIELCHIFSDYSKYYGKVSKFIKIEILT